jgi:hypothetical protein
VPIWLKNNSPCGALWRAYRLRQGIALGNGMRRILTAGFYLLLIVAGVYLLWGLFEFGGRGLTALAGGSLAVFGSYMLWLDFFSRERLPKQ